MTAKQLVSMRRITKSFGAETVNDRIDFDLQAGEIHALLGENGAGKSTLMNILSGVYRQDAGEINLHGRSVTIHSPKDAIACGVGMIHQHFKLVENLTAAENIILGYKKGLLLNRKKISREIADFSKAYGLSIQPQDCIYQMSVGEKQRVEILKALYRGADILILDEPTAVLTPQEAKELFVILKKMAKEGCGVIIITHKMQEVMEIADRITVLRKGKKVGTQEISQVNEQILAEMMMGQMVVRERVKNVNLEGEAVLAVQNLTVKGDKGVDAVRNVSFSVKQGEILGIAGISGSGQKELAEAIAGLRKAESGSIQMHQEEIAGKTAKQLIDLGIGFVPEDRLGMGLIGSMDIADNLILKDYRKAPISKGIFINKQKAKERAKAVIKQFDVKIADSSGAIKSLSGGNLQKILLGREILEEPKVLIAAYPVRGLDIGTTEAVYNLLLEQRDRGCAVIFISEDLDEILELSDRIMVMEGGRTTGIVKPQDTSVEEIGRMMLNGRVS
ncbi:ABC transporter ATP-binding protein [Geosporobacter ferrireducens]|uniref:ABC transporter ATP-binding protein n=1 Tax=Geosporobacter ferrireducens TaxID=1424294 RepID=A0A1D8GJ82_9FIRM|nr:ABC transporter ATP-binding protein [Geosporobacter ferrireducens]AOT70967.1 ABC transporter ATP-binding protein [Geosporobacter ferrireducens]MTI53682.1 ABC transporter ATP-binding protein [Geosporobacter ferrireducens]